MKRFDCKICNLPDLGEGIGGWSIDSDLWNNTIICNANKLNNISTEMIICIDCFEKLLGRKLTKSDFTYTIDNITNNEVRRYFDSTNDLDYQEELKQHDRFLQTHYEIASCIQISN
jgi:hypothetical protein